MKTLFDDWVVNFITNAFIMISCLWVVSDAPNWAFWMFAIYLAGRFSDDMVKPE